MVVKTLSNLAKRFYACALIVVLVSASTVSAANRFSVATGNWNATSTWAATSGGASGASVPIAGDVVTIEGADNVTVNVATAACASVQLGSPTGGGGVGTLTFAASSQLTVSGAVSLGNNGSTTRFGTITMTAGGTLQCGSISSNSTTDVFTQGTGTLELTATNTFPTVDIGVEFAALNNLAVSTGTTTLSGAKAVNGTLSLIGGTLAAGANLTMGALSSIARSGGSMTGTLQGTNVYDVTYTGNSKTTGPELVTTGLRNFTVNLTAGQTLTLNQNRLPDGNLSVSAGTFNLSTFTLNRSTAGGTLTVSSGATLKRGGTLPFPTSYSTHAIGGTSTVEYSGTAQTVANLNSAQTYGNLTLSGSATKTLQAATTTISGNLTLSGTASATAVVGLTVNGDFTIGSGPAVFSASTFTHNLKGNWSNSGTFNANTSTFNMNGTSAQTMSGSTFNNLTINNAAGVTLNGAGTVNGTLTLTTGNLTLGSSNLTIGSSGSISGPPAIGTSTSNYIVTDGSGVLTINGAGNKLFPIGPTTSSYNPVQINNTGTSDDFSARVQVGFTGLVPPTNPSEVLNRAWIITEGTAGGSTATLTFQYNDGEYTFPPFSPGGPLYIARHNGVQWVATAATATPGPPHIVSASGFTTFSPFGVTSNTNSLPIQLASFTGTFQNNTVRLNWTTISEVNNYGFYVEKRSVGSLEWWSVENSFVAGHGTTNEPQNYVFFDHTVSTGSWQYRLHQVDLDGTSHFTEPINVNVLTSVKELAPIEFALKQNYPNPFNPETNIKFSVETTGRATLELYNMLGQRVATLFDDVVEAGFYRTVRFSGVNLASGVYLYRLQSGKKNDLKKLVLLK